MVTSYDLMAIDTCWELFCGFNQQNMGTQWELEGGVTNNAVATDWVGSSVSTN